MNSPYMKTIAGDLHWDKLLEYQFKPRAIAVSLANLCRFSGQLLQYYSVAQHSVLVASILPHELQLAGLLHDAHESFDGYGDIIRPMKWTMPGGYKRHVANVQYAIAQQFNVEWLFFNGSQVEDADNRVLATELRQFYQQTDKRLPEPLNFTIEPLLPAPAALLWLDAFRQLTETEQPLSLYAEGNEA